MTTTRIKDLAIDDEFLMCGGAFKVSRIENDRLVYKTIGGHASGDVSVKSNLIVELIRRVPPKPKEILFSELIERYSKNVEATFQVFAKIVEKEFLVTVDQMRSKNRRIEVVQARSAAMYLFTTYTLFDHETISLEFNMDRTSVTTAVHRAKKLMEQSKDFRESLQEITAQLKSKAA